jgi:hypothetical protein
VSTVAPPLTGRAGTVPAGPGTDQPPVTRVPVLRPLRVLPSLRPAVAALVLLAFVGLQATRSLWLTEALAVRAARAPRGVFDAALRTDDLSTAVSQILARPLALHSSYPEIIRSPGYVLGILTVLLMASAGRRLGMLVATSWRPPAVAQPASIGVAAALLAACHGMLQATAGEVGPYAVSLFAVAATVDLVLRVVTRRHWTTAVLAGVAAGVSVAMHLSAAAVVVAALAALVVLPTRRLPVGRLVVVLGTAAVVAALLLHETLGTATARSQWVGTPGESNSVGSSLTVLGGGSAAGDITTQPGKALSRLATLALILLIALALVHLSRMLRVTGRSSGSFVLAFPLALLLGPLVVATVAAHAGADGTAGRNLVVAVPGVVLLAAVELYRSGGPSSSWLGIAEWRNGYSAAAIGATGALLGALLVGVGGVSSLNCAGVSCSREEWSTAVARIELLRDPGDVVIVYAPQTVLPYDLAATRVASRLTAAGEPPLPRVVWPTSVDSGLAAAGSSSAQVAAAVKAASGATRVWLVLSHDTGTHAEPAEEIDAALHKLYNHRCTYDLPGKSSGICTYDIWNLRGVTIHLYTHVGKAPKPADD